MSLLRLFSANRKATSKAYTTGNFATTHNLPGHDSERLPDKTESSDSLSDTLGVNYSTHPSGNVKFSPLLICVNFLVYYRVYAEDGAIPTKTPVAPGNPFLGRIKATSVSPPHIVKTLRCSIAKVEGIKDPNKTSLFLTPYCQSPVCDTDKVILNGNGLGSTPHEPLAIVARISNSERSASLESEVAADTEPDTTPPATRIRYRTSIRHSCFYFRTNIWTIGGRDRKSVV